MTGAETDPIRVVHVDDDPEIRELAATFLLREDDRLDIHAAGSASEALDILSDEQIHCVVTDYQLPDMDCGKFAAAIREEAPELPVVLFTGRDRPRIDGELLESFTAYLQKGSGVEQYGKLARAIIAAVESGDRVETDGGSVEASTAIDEFLATVEVEDTQAILGQTLRALDDGLFFLDTAGEVVSWNQSLSALTGHDALDGMNPTGLFVVADRDEIEAAIADARDHGTASVEARLHTQTGRERPVEFHASRLSTTAGETVGVAGIVRDITDRVRTENRRDHETDRLEEIVSSVSHDLRNPLNVMAGRLQLARDLGDEEHFEALERATRDFERLIEELVDLARVGHPVTDPSQLALDEYARATWGGLDTGDATLEIQTDRTVAADPDRLTTILEALFENAIVHAEGPVTVTLEATDDGFAIVDDGPGFPTDNRERLLEHGGTTTVDRNGVGLALAQRGAQAHGWSVSIAESESGGTRVELTVSRR